MKIVIFGLSISSAWGNGHATLLRGLFRALKSQGHDIIFFERDVPYYAAHRDAFSFPYVRLHLYSDWYSNVQDAVEALRGADAGMVTSYCPDGAAACELVCDSKLSRTVFYDMDTPVTLMRLDQGEAVPYLPSGGLGGFDLVLSYTGGDALRRLKDQLGACRVAPLYGWVDTQAHYRTDPKPEFRADLSYIGTYSADRHAKFEELFLEPARQLSERRFVIAGAMYDDRAGWPPNVLHFEHVPPQEHCAFYSSSPLTLSITRGPMAAMGYCPSGRLFEAAACGTAVLSDWWTGLETFFEPESEILVAGSCAEAMRAIEADPTELVRMGARARERVLDCHTAETRAQRLLSLLESPRDEMSKAPELFAGKER